MPSSSTNAGMLTRTQNRKQKRTLESAPGRPEAGDRTAAGKEVLSSLLSHDPFCYLETPSSFVPDAVLSYCVTYTDLCT